MEIFEDSPFVFQGFEIPSDSPFFLTVLSIHVLAGLTCVVAGVGAMLAKKQHGIHSKAGSIYYRVLWIAFITATIIAVLRWKEDYHLFILGLISFCSAVIAKRAVKYKWQKWSI